MPLRAQSLENPFGRRKMTRSTLFLAAAALVGVTFAAGAQQAVTLTHVHGLAYSGDGKRLMIPSHHGLAVYSGGKWSMAPGPQHDYMGYAATSQHLYSSGHPAAGSGMVNPFGLIRSRDGGKTWDRLGLEGETDFHLLATGWTTNAIYVWNPAPNSRMRAAGLHSTRNEGFLWKPARAAGLEGAPHALAVHPDDAALVAAATAQGIYLSRDAGEQFKLLAGDLEGLSVFFDLDGKQLWYGGYQNGARLARAPLSSGAPAQIALPPMPKDAVAYIAQNPAARTEYALATFGRSVFLTNDAGRTWKRISDRGRGD
jgi:photosystem II stability/assembly factor-like uncharacterized protein